MAMRLFLSLILFICARQSQAALGGNVSTVESDRVSTKAQAKAVTSENKYSVHTMDASGTTVKEFVDAGGTVFAVSWKGLARPDLEILFGNHYQEYAHAKAQKPRDPGRAPLHVQTSTLVVKHAGHMRAVTGQAYLPDLVPSGVNVEDLK